MLIGSGLLIGGGASAALVACGGGGGGSGNPPANSDTSQPILLALSPEPDEANVSRDKIVELHFSEPVSASSASVTLVGPREPVTASVNVAGSTVSLTPARRLAFGARYNLSVSTAVRDSAGNPFAGISSSFTTLPRNPAMALGGMVMDTYVRRRWADPLSQPWNVLPHLVDNGFEWLRVAVTTQKHAQLRATSAWHTIPWQPGFWSSLEVSGALLREGADLGMRLQAILFLSHEAAHAGRQARPPEWAGLSEADVALRIEQHAAEVAAYYHSLGLQIEVFEIGNEIDFGVCGIRLGDTVTVPPGVDPVNDPVWMRDHVWSLGAPLLEAAIRGVRSVYPAAKIMLHVAGFGYSNNNIAATGFFQSMVDLNVPFDLAGLSYPYMHGGPEVPQPYFAQPVFLSALESIATHGRPMQIVEFAYPANASGITHTPASAYPYTPAGQADFIRDFATAVRGRVQSLMYFYPDWYEGFDPAAPALQGGGLFSAAGIARPGLEVFNAIAERRLLT